MLFKWKVRLPPGENYKQPLNLIPQPVGNIVPPTSGLTYDTALPKSIWKMSLTMTGYWRLSLKLLKGTGNVESEDVT